MKKLHFCYVKKWCIHLPSHPPPSTSKNYCSILIDVTRHLMVNQQFSGLPAFIRPYTSMPGVWSNKGFIRYVPCHGCTKSIFVLFSWQSLWKNVCTGLLLLSLSNAVCPACQNSWQDSHSARAIYESVTQNLDKLVLVLFCFYFVSILTKGVIELWSDITLTSDIPSLRL